jgi:hypothetical protein
MPCSGVGHLHRSYISKLSQLNWDLVLNAQAFCELSDLQNMLHSCIAYVPNHGELVEGWSHPTQLRSSHATYCISG